MYHPAAALHQGQLMTTLFRDMESVPTALLQARERRNSGSSAPQRADIAAQPEPAAATGPAAQASPVEGPAEEVSRVATSESAAAAQSIELTPQTDPTDQLTLF
jgi:hypothetical protein